jgi:UDP-4-amino-4,6-dideoxy-N-acetyl-beta-L-altrosamine N-acetyltransferase
VQVTEIKSVVRQPSVAVRPIVADDLRTILKWRNHPLVRQVMFTDHEISMDEHVAWWHNAKDDPGRELLLFVYDNIPAGVINFFDIDRNAGSCHWGFYLNNESPVDSSRNLQIWLALEQAAITYAFDTIECNMLLAETFAFNEQVIQIHGKFGFEAIGTFAEEKNGEQVKVIRMALKKSKVSTDVDAEKAISDDVEPIKVAFLGSANWDLIAADFVQRYKHITGNTAAVIPVPFGQYRSHLSDKSSHIRTRESDYYIFCERVEDFLDSPSAVLDAQSARAAAGRFEEYLDVITSARSMLSGVFFILDMAPVRPLSTTLSDAVYDKETVRGFINDLNQKAARLAATLPDCHLIRLSTLVESFGSANADPGKYFHLGRVAYHNRFGRHINDRLIATMLASTGKTARVLVLDLDNTLWCGVIGDDDLKGIQLGGDYPGSVYTAIQKCIKSLKDRGIALAICSKNTEEIAIEAIKQHPGMILKVDDFVSTRINWQDKVVNIRQIADEIGVGLASICLIDDSPYERDAVRRMLPEVIVPELPVDKSTWVSFLLDYPYLASVHLTQEDKDRAQRYKSRSRIRSEAASFANKEDYWRSLRMALHFHQLNDGNLTRTLQLLAKTNQFNMTTRRHSELDLERLAGKGAMAIPIGLSDKYGEHEIIGLLILKSLQDKTVPVEIDTFLLSCRVLGRGVEKGILDWAVSLLKTRGFRTLTGQYLKTARNQPAAGVYTDYGFESADGENYHLDVKTCDAKVPDWFALNIDEGLQS